MEPNYRVIEGALYHLIEYPSPFNITFPGYKPNKDYYYRSRYTPQLANSPPGWTLWLRTIAQDSGTLCFIFANPKIPDQTLEIEIACLEGDKLVTKDDVCKALPAFIKDGGELRKWSFSRCPKILKEYYLSQNNTDSFSTVILENIRGVTGSEVKSLPECLEMTPLVDGWIIGYYNK